MARHTRYQGAIIQDHQVLLIRHRQHATGIEYWVIPGGGLDPPETEQNCVIREMKEETNLDVVIERLLFDEPEHPDSPYAWRKTYLCRPVSGVATPGHEPEPEAAAAYSISEVRWFDLRDESNWDEDLRQDPFTYPQLIRLREELGYTSG
ncbi:MAG: NUDIX hydrolase [Anaerolineales bacterium]